MTRFQRDDTRVKFLRDPLGEGYYIVTDAPSYQRVEHFPLHLYPFHCNLYKLQDYQELILCPECNGKGWFWVPDREGEADREECMICQGCGGTKRERGEE